MPLNALKGRGFGLAALLPLILAACTAAPAREAASAMPTIVSLNPCTDAILAEVTAPGQLLAISAYSQDPAGSSMDLAKARHYRAVSGTVEEVAMLRPELVVGATFMSPSTSAALGNLGIRTEKVGIAGTVEESEAQIRRLAALAGHPERGEALIGRIEASLKRAAPPPGAPIAAIVWQSGGIVPGKNTLISDLLRRTGFTNAAAARGLGQADMLPLEEMLANPPRLILAAGDQHSEEDRLLRHPALAALKQTAREPLNPALLWCGGPTIERAANRLGAVRRGIEGAPRGSFDKLSLSGGWSGAAPKKPLPFRGGVGVGAVAQREAESDRQPPPPTPPLKGRGS